MQKAKIHLIGYGLRTFAQGKMRNAGASPFFGMGEDLPLAVYQQWRYWCQFPHYFIDDPEMSRVLENFAKVHTPITAANALDDQWALPRSRDAFMQAYTNASIERIDLEPKRFPDGIGHMGYFRKKAQPLWENVLECFEPYCS